MLVFCPNINWEGMLKTPIMIAKWATSFFFSMFSFYLKLILGIRILDFYIIMINCSHYYHQIFFIVSASISCFELMFFLSHTDVVTPNACLIVYLFLFFYIQLSFLYLMPTTQWQHRVKASYLNQIEICLLIIVYSSFTFNMVIDWCDWI